MKTRLISLCVVLGVCSCIKIPTLSRDYLPALPYPVIPELNEPESFKEFLIKSKKSYRNETEYKLREAMFEKRKHHSKKHNIEHEESISKLKAYNDLHKAIQRVKMDKTTPFKAVLNSRRRNHASNSVHRSRNHLFYTALNYYSDLSNSELIRKIAGYKKKNTTFEIRFSSAPEDQENQTIPDSFDWREKGAVTKVKSQLLNLKTDCGACWAFAVTGAIEGHVFVETGELNSLSEQNLIDCSGDGCDGGFPLHGFQYVLENKGIALGVKYPYTAVENTCKYSEDKKGAEIKGFMAIKVGDENEMKRIIATKGPIACSVHAGIDTFIQYKNGIYNDDECKDGDLDHSILVVGYGSENGHDYWIIKNSWGEGWGQGGYMKLLRNDNMCHIADECSFPIV